MLAEIPRPQELQVVTIPAKVEVLAVGTQAVEAMVARVVLA